ncbi:MAG: hypothetical protein ISS79_01200 [Phycisphaerae bacterium]|nr:hypothetical protein [Phycisphaerae bacterium]
MSIKLRIAAAAAVGVAVIGLGAWPLVEPTEPFEAVRLANLGFGGAVTLLAAAFAVGLIGYFVSWPHGREIGILAVPSGLAIWAARTGNMASQVQMSPAIDQRQALLAALKWEPIFWLAVVAAGFAGVLCGRQIRSAPTAAQPKEKPKPTPALYLNAAVALLASVLIALITLGRLAQDITMTNGSLGSVMGQPATGQIVFGVIVAFGLAGFIVSNFLNAGYVWPIIAAALVPILAISSYAKPHDLNLLVQYWPPVFFSNVAISILPIQMVAFGTIGAITGYWMGIRYDFWRRHEI